MSIKETILPLADALVKEMLECTGWCTTVIDSKESNESRAVLCAALDAADRELEEANQVVANFEVAIKKADAEIERLNAVNEAEFATYVRLGEQKNAEIETLKYNVDTWYERFMEAAKRCHELQAENAALRSALKLAIDSHGISLLTDPPQEAWKFYRVDDVARAALALKEQT